MNPILLITNAEAGSNDEDAVQTVVEVLRERVEVEVAKTSSQEELASVLDNLGDRTIVVAGGDGSLHAVISSLHSSKQLSGSTLGLIPLGTGNDFARTLGIPLEPKDAAIALLASEPESLDLIVDDEDNVVVNNVHVGASAQASRYGARWKKRLGKLKLGIFGYPIGAALAAVRPPFIRLKVVIDGQVVVTQRKHLLMVAVGNGTSVGGGTEITPDAHPADGKLDVMISYATGPLERLAFVWDMRKGEHDDRDDVQTRRAGTVEITGDGFHVSADGELAGPIDHRSWRLERAAYKMLLPPGRASTSDVH